MYYSNKIRAAVPYKRHLSSLEEKDLEKSIAWLSIAAENWHELVEIIKPVYNRAPLVHLWWNGKGEDYFHWSEIEEQVLNELDWLKSLSRND
jgi:hypothetical protein